MKFLLLCVQGVCCRRPRSHLENQQLLTLNMLIFIVRRGWRLPAFVRVCVRWGCTHVCVCVRAPYFFYFIVGHGQFAGPPLTIPPPHTEDNSRRSTRFYTNWRQTCGAIWNINHIYSTRALRGRTEGDPASALCILLEVQTSNFAHFQMDLTKTDQRHFAWSRISPQQGGEQSIQMGWKGSLPWRRRRHRPAAASGRGLARRRPAAATGRVRRAPPGTASPRHRCRNCQKAPSAAPRSGPALGRHPSHRTAPSPGREAGEKV